MARGAAPAAPAVAVRVRWTAGDATGLAHAHRSSFPTRTACRLPAVSEQFAWPTRARCPECIAVLAAEGIS